MSKITAKRLENPDENAIKGRTLFVGDTSDGLSVAEYRDYSIANVFLEREATPRTVVGYAGIKGAYSVGGIKTYKISSPTYIPDENAFLKFDAWLAKTGQIKVSVEVGDVEQDAERYTSFTEIKGGGKWKRIVLKPADFKGEKSGMPLKNFSDGKALLFDCDNEEVEFAIANVLWL